MIDSSVTIKRGCGVLFVLLLQETGEQQRQQMKYIEVKAPLSGGKKEIVSKADQQFITNKTRGCACVCEPDSYPSQEKKQYGGNEAPRRKYGKTLPCLADQGEPPTRLIQLHTATLVLYPPLSGD
mmetsp:Transcript_15967/g.17246  ORF Transcript_15967/g.17246 Transcript_15967/m.17246 type:complete len:125 (+) Transcript_15967:1-375(+)